MATDIISALARIVQRHDPGKIAVLVPTAAAARWVQRQLLSHGPLVGATIRDLQGLLRAHCLEALGEPAPHPELLEFVAHALEPDPAFREVLDQPAYLDKVLSGFAELHRSRALPSTEPPVDHPVGHPRDEAFLAAFERFVVCFERYQQDHPDAWYAGTALDRLVHGPDSLSLSGLRACVHIGFPHPLPWQFALFTRLCAEPLSPREVDAPSRPRPTIVSCAGPQAEVAWVARQLRRRAGAREPAAVLVPTGEVPLWRARMAHRDVPVRAFVGSHAQQSATARFFEALVRVVLQSGRVARIDLDHLMFGSFVPLWPMVAEDLGLERAPSRGDLEEVWAHQRRGSGTLSSYADRIQSATLSAVHRVTLEGERRGWDAQAMAARVARVQVAHRCVARALRWLGSLHGSVELREGLLRVHLSRGASQLARDGAASSEHAPLTPEIVAAQIIMEGLARHSGEPLADACADILHRLSSQKFGQWHEDIAVDGPPAVWLMSYDAALPGMPWPATVFACGLDRFPPAPLPDVLLTEARRAALGLDTSARRYAGARGLIESVLESGSEVHLCWRHRDAVGSPCAPGPFIARELSSTARAPHRVGVDQIALATQGPACAPIEYDLVCPSPELARRVAAMSAHERDEVGPHTGALGVTVQPTRPYSASALQTYARNPYLYFLERVLGVKEPGELLETLDAMEQGTVVHDGLERALRPLLEEGPVSAVERHDELQARTKTELEAAYRERAQYGMSAAVWKGQLERWEYETELWWQELRKRLAIAYEGAEAPFRWPARDSPLTPGDRVLAVELPFEIEIDLGRGAAKRRIRLSGMVDRIEHDSELGRLAIVDYKTGRTPGAWRIEADLRSGAHLQLPLYALACTEMLLREPQRLGFSSDSFAPVGTMRLEYFKRENSYGPGKPKPPAARGFAVTHPVGENPDTGEVELVLEAATRFTLGFVTGIEAGYFPLVARVPPFRGRVRRDEEVVRILPDADSRATSLPAPYRKLEFRPKESGA